MRMEPFPLILNCCTTRDIWAHARFLHIVSHHSLAQAFPRTIMDMDQDIQIPSRLRSAHLLCHSSAMSRRRV